MAAETQFCLKKRQKHESYFNVCLLGEPNNFPCEIMVKIEALVIMLIFRPLSSLLSCLNSVGEHCAVLNLMFPPTLLKVRVFFSPLLDVFHVNNQTMVKLISFCLLRFSNGVSTEALNLGKRK